MSPALVTPAPMNLAAMIPAFDRPLFPQVLCVQEEAAWPTGMNFGLALSLFLRNPKVAEQLKVLL